MVVRKLALAAHHYYLTFNEHLCTLGASPLHFGPYTISSILICSIVVCSTLTIAEEQSKRHCRWLCQPHYSSKRASMFAQVMHIFVIVVLSWG